jgi:hypothetical protein
LLLHAARPAVRTSAGIRNFFMNNTPIIKFGVDPGGPDACEPDAFQFIACSNADQAFPIR